MPSLVVTGRVWSIEKYEQLSARMYYYLLFILYLYILLAQSYKTCTFAIFRTAYALVLGIVDTNPVVHMYIRVLFLWFGKIWAESSTTSFLNIQSFSYALIRSNFIVFMSKMPS